MLPTVKEQCVTSSRINRCVSVYARRLLRVYRRSSELGDLTNELWIAVFEAVEKRYHPGAVLEKIACDAVYSKYGHMLPHNGERVINKKKVHLIHNETTYLDETNSRIDSSYELIEAQCTLDQIEQSLNRRYAESRVYRIAVLQLRYFRRGYNETEFCKKTGTPRSTSDRVFSTVVQKEWEKLNAEAI